MVKVKTFTCELKIFQTRKELNELDSQVNTFLQENSVQKVVSVSDTCTSGSGDSVGIIRVVTYEE